MFYKETDTATKKQKRRRKFHRNEARGANEDENEVMGNEETEVAGSLQEKRKRIRTLDPKGNPMFYIKFVFILKNLF